MRASNNQEPKTRAGESTPLNRHDFTRRLICSPQHFTVGAVAEFCSNFISVHLANGTCYDKPFPCLIPSALLSGVCCLLYFFLLTLIRFPDHFCRWDLVALSPGVDPLCLAPFWSLFFPGRFNRQKMHGHSDKSEPRADLSENEVRCLLIIYDATKYAVCCRGNP